MDKLAKINQSLASLYLKKQQLYLTVKPALADKEDAALHARYDQHDLESVVLRLEQEEGNQPDDARYAEGTEALAAAERQTEQAAEQKNALIAKLEADVHQINQEIIELKKAYSGLSEALFTRWLKPVACEASDDEGDDEVGHALGQRASKQFLDLLKPSLQTHNQSFLDVCSRFVQAYPLVQDQLLSLVKQSREDINLHIAAANAITVLNHAHRSFANEDFSYVNIAHADLSGAHLYKTSFKGADLSNVKLYGATLNDVDFTDSKLVGVNVGLSLSVRIPKKACALALSADGQLCAVGDEDGQIQLWNLQNLQLVTALKSEGGEILDLVFSSNAQKLVSYMRGELCVWNLDTNRCIKQAFKHRHYRAFFLSDQSSKLASFFSNEWSSRLKIHNIKEDGSLDVIDHAFRRVPPSAIIDSSVLRILFSDHENKVALWETVCEIGKQAVAKFEVETVSGESEEEPVLVFMRLDRELTRLITCHESIANYFTIWTLEDGQPLRIVKFSEIRRSYLTISPNGQYVSGSAKNHRLCLWDSATGTLQTGPAMADESGLKPLFCSDGRSIIFPATETELTSWHFDDNSFSDICQLTTLVVASTGQYLVSADLKKGNMLRLWEASTGRCIGSFAEQAHPILNMALSQDVNRIVTADKAGGIRLWDIAKQQLLCEDSLGVPQVDYTVWGLAFGCQDSYLAVGYYRIAFSLKDCASFLYILDANSLDVVQRAEVGPKRYDGLYWLDDYRLLIYANKRFSKEIKLIEIETKESFLLEQSRKITSAFAISDDRTLVAAGMKQNKVGIWDTKTRELKLCLEKLISKVLRLTFSTDNALLVTASDDHKLCVWSLFKVHSRSGWLNWNNQYGACLQTLSGHKSQITALAFSKASNYLISGDARGVVRVWDVYQGGCVQTFQDQASHVLQIKPHWNDKGFFTSGTHAHMLSYALQDEPGVLAPATCLWSNTKTFMMSQSVLEEINRQAAQASVKPT